MFFKALMNTTLPIMLSTVYFHLIPLPDEHFDTLQPTLSGRLSIKAAFVFWPIQLSSDTSLPLLSYQC